MMTEVLNMGQGDWGETGDDDGAMEHQRDHDWADHQGWEDPGFGPM
jgi:hypothetical protein